MIKNKKYWGVFIGQPTKYNTTLTPGISGRWYYGNKIYKSKKDAIADAELYAQSNTWWNYEVKLLTKTQVLANRK